MSAEADRDLEYLLADAKRVAAVFGAQTVRNVILAFAGWQGVEAASITTPARNGTLTLSAEEVEMCRRTGLDPAEVTKAKAAALANGTYPGLAG